MLAKLPEARPGSMEVLHDASVTWRYIAPVGHTLEMVMRPDYWRNVTRETGQQRVPGRHAYNRIEVLAEDGTWEADLRVMSVADGLVQVRLLREWNAPARPGRKPSVPDGYIVEHIPNSGWRVLDPHGAVIAAQLTTEEDATRAASAHARKAKGSD